MNKDDIVKNINQVYALYGKKLPSFYVDLIAEYIISSYYIENLPTLTNIISNLPNLLENIYERSDGFYSKIYGVTENKKIIMNANISDEDKKLYFFHELTHAILSRDINGIEIQSTYDGNNGMFFTEGMTQYIGEVMYENYCFRKGKKFEMKNVQNIGDVRGQNDRTTYGPLKHYRYNFNVLYMMCMAYDIDFITLINNSFSTNCRRFIKSNFNDNNKFEKFMEDLETIYYIDKASISNYSALNSNEMVQIRNNNKTFYANFDLERKLMDKVESELITEFVIRHNIDYVLENASNFSKYITSERLRKNFMNYVSSKEYYLAESTCL